MRILHVVHQYPPDHIGGTEHYTQALAKAQADAGHSVAVFYPRLGHAGLVVEEREGVRVYVGNIGARSRLDVFMAVFGSRLLQGYFDQVLADFKPAILHIQHLMGLPLSLIEHAKHRGLHCVMTLHDYWALCGNAQLLTNYSRQVCNGPRLWLNCARCAVARIGRPELIASVPVILSVFAARARIVRRALSQIDAFLAPSQLVGRAAIRAGANPKRVCRLSYGIDMRGVRPRAARRDGEFRVAYIGSLAWQKGVHVLVEAFNAVPEPAVLTVYGDPSVFPDYSRNLQAIARSPRIRFAGKLARSDLWPTLAETDVVAVPSIWYENQPLTILEAYAAGVPVMASDLGALPEHVEEGRSGWLVKAGDVAAWWRILTGLATGALPRIDHVRVKVSDVRDAHLLEVLAVYEQALTEPA